MTASSNNPSQFDDIGVDTGNDVFSASASTSTNPHQANQNIKVAVRLRPLIEDSESPLKEEKRKRNHHHQENIKRAWNIEKTGEKTTLIQKGSVRKAEGRTVFHFDQAFDEDVQTPLVYKSIARPMVRSVLNGKHATIFAYGQTGSGKTFTMQGDGKMGSGQGGIIQLVTSDLFRYMRKGEAKKREFVVKVSYFEIYNENIRDLLSDDIVRNISSSSSSPVTNRSNREKEIKIRTNEHGEIVVNVIQKKVSNFDEVIELLIEGKSHRTVAATDMNEYSSRSHTVFRITVESRSRDIMNEEQQLPVESQGQEIVRISDFNLVDLAGSESLKSTNNTGTRQREGAKINKSLLALTTVIQSLSQPVKKRPKHINYRDSKLTRILQPHLSGNAEMAILCCATPSKAFVEETRSTLKFAARAKLVQMKPKINEVMDDGAIINKLEKELFEVRKQLAELKLQEQSRDDKYRMDDSDEYEDDEYGTLQNNDHPLPELVQERDCDTSNDTSLKSPNNTALAFSTSSSHSSNEIQMMFDERMNDSSMNDSSGSGFQLDAADPDVAKKAVQRYMRGRVDSIDPDDCVDSSDESSAYQSGAVESFDSPGKRTKNTEPTEDDSFNNPEESYAEISLKPVSQVSNPETIRIADRGRSRFESTDSCDIAPNGRLENTWSWDAMDLIPKHSMKVGQSLRALRSLTKRNSHIPDEVTIINTASITGNNKCLTDRLNDAGNRINFLEGKLDVSNDVIEATFRDLEKARHCIQDLVYRNVQMKVRLNKKQREDTKEEYEHGEVMVEQYWILKGSLYISLFFFLTGSQELFMAAVIFVWLVLEG